MFPFPSRRPPRTSAERLSMSAERCAVRPSITDVESFHKKVYIVIVKKVYLVKLPFKRHFT